MASSTAVVSSSTSNHHRGGYPIPPTAAAESVCSLVFLVLRAATLRCCSALRALSGGRGKGCASTHARTAFLLLPFYRVPAHTCVHALALMGGVRESRTARCGETLSRYSRLFRAHWDRPTVTVPIALQGPGTARPRVSHLLREAGGARCTKRPVARELRLQRRGGEEPSGLRSFLGNRRTGVLRTWQGHTPTSAAVGGVRPPDSRTAFRRAVRAPPVASGSGCGGGGTGALGSS